MYTVWMDDHKIGQTQFEVHAPNLRKRAGCFHPTPYGITVLPGITAMMPALFDFHAMCRDRGIDTDTDEGAESGLAAFEFSAESRRVQAAAAMIAQLELRDPDGRVLAWDSILITDTDDLRGMVAKHSGDRSPPATPSDKDPVRFFISTTLARPGAAPADIDELVDADTSELC